MLVDITVDMIRYAISHSLGVHEAEMKSLIFASRARGEPAVNEGMCDTVVV